MCKGKIAGVQVCIITNFWFAGVHQTIVVKIWKSYCTFSEYFCLQNLFASRPIFLLLKIFKNFEYKTSKHGIGRGVLSKSRGQVLKTFPGDVAPSGQGILSNNLTIMLTFDFVPCFYQIDHGDQEFIRYLFYF